jgi:hypothetical protein
MRAPALYRLYTAASLALLLGGGVRARSKVPRLNTASPLRSLSWTKSAPEAEPARAPRAARAPRPRAFPILITRPRRKRAQVR